MGREQPPHDAQSRFSSPGGEQVGVFGLPVPTSFDITGIIITSIIG